MDEGREVINVVKREGSEVRDELIRNNVCTQTPYCQIPEVRQVYARILSGMSSARELGRRENLKTGKGRSGRG